MKAGGLVKQSRGQGPEYTEKGLQEKRARKCLPAKQNPREALGLELVVKEGRDEKEN